MTLNDRVVYRNMIALPGLAMYNNETDSISGKDHVSQYFIDVGLRT